MYGSPGNDHHARPAQYLARSLMGAAVDLGAAFVTDAHAAEWLAGFAAHRFAADFVGLENGCGNSCTRAYRDGLAVEVDAKRLAQVKGSRFILLHSCETSIRPKYLK